MNTLHFCRDGILRRTITTRLPEVTDDYRFETRLIPVQAWEASTDPDVFLKSLHDGIVFEDGLTVGEVFENLAPWAETMRGVACMDFPAFLEEMRSTHDNPMQDVDKITISFDAEISAVPRYEREGPIFEDRKMNLGTAAFTGRISLDQGWNMTARVKEEYRAEYDGAESVSLSFCPLSEWKHLPICIDKAGNLRDETANKRASVHLGTEQPLTAADHKNVKLTASPEGVVFGHDIVIDAPEPTFFHALIRGFLWDVGFHYSPVHRDETRDSIMASVDEINAMESLEELDAPKGNAYEIDGEDRAEIALMGKLVAKASEMGLAVSKPKPQGDDA
ncbi:hypothetical protein ACGYLO_11795 [Sulfitobacter sp. 1A13353]|uniref:hypothetical protein n=1 Tax=Sulfitobacter sp. 1A13353 TaxID=3368568 RepID=UPI003747004B